MDESPFLTDLLHDRVFVAENDDENDGDSISILSEGCDEFSLLSDTNSVLDDVLVGPDERPTDQDGCDTLHAPSEDASDVDERPGNHPADDRRRSHDVSASDTTSNSRNAHATENGHSLQDRAIPKGKSIAHHYLEHEKALFCSFDIETGGEFCGILQMSAQIFRVKNCNNKPNISIVEETFNHYVKPHDGAIWDPNATKIHGLTASSPKIMEADEINLVWHNFVEYICRHVEPNEKCILVAYNGETCDLKWLWKLTQAPNSPLSVPPQMEFFMDPLHVIKSYKSCPFHPTKSKLDSLELGCVWKFVTGENLNNAHDSLIDAKAQTDIVTSNHFIPFIDKTKSIRNIDEIFSKRDTLDMIKKLEPSRPVHDPWKEQKKASSIEWTPLSEDSYNGSQSGGRLGPSKKMMDVARGSNSLADLFLLIFTINLFGYIAEMTENYAYKEWVTETERRDRDGKPTKKKFFVPFHRRSKRESLPAGARHRADNARTKYTITPYFIMAWVAIAIISGAHFGDRRNHRKVWMNAPYGISIPYIQNAMPRDAFEFMRRYIHFTDNKDKKPTNHPHYNPLYKVQYVLNELMNGMRTAWIAGDKITIDESMIKYAGRAIAFVQFMPAKPIKHGVKVFAVCCAFTAVLIGFEVYVGSDKIDNSAKAVVGRLLESANLTAARGRVLYTDNWYTSVDLAKMLFEKYGWHFCGTITPTDKKSRANEDVPFLKLSNGALRDVERGWFREAVLEKKTPTGKRYCIQCSTWRDKKQVMFLHTNLVGATESVTVKRHVKNKKQRVTLQAPQSQHDYAKHFNAVDRNDRDSSDNTTTMRTNRWYLRLFFWVLDRVVHVVFVVACFCVKYDVGPPEWKSYLNKNGGREKFQIDLGMQLLNYAIDKAWSDTATPPPDWMRQSKFIPCDCTKCFFCLNDLTNGIFHKPEKKVVIHHSDGKKINTTRCTDEQVVICNRGNYCKMCYRKKDEGLLKETKRAGYKQSKLVCPSCDEVCKMSWAEG